MRSRKPIEATHNGMVSGPIKSLTVGDEVIGSQTITLYGDHTGGWGYKTKDDQDRPVFMQITNPDRVEVVAWTLLYYLVNAFGREDALNCPHIHKDYVNGRCKTCKQDWR